MEKALPAIPIAIFWDVETCMPSDVISFDFLIQQIRESFGIGHQELVFLVVTVNNLVSHKFLVPIIRSKVQHFDCCEVRSHEPERYSDDWFSINSEYPSVCGRNKGLSDVGSANLTLHITPADVILHHYDKFCSAHAPLATVVVISSELPLLQKLAAVESAVHTIVLTDVSHIPLTGVHELYRWKQFVHRVSRFPKREIPKAKSSRSPIFRSAQRDSARANSQKSSILDTCQKPTIPESETLLIINLPSTAWTPKDLRGLFSRLSCKHYGTVVSCSQRLVAIRFPNVMRAQKGKKKLEQYEGFGSRLEIECAQLVGAECTEAPPTGDRPSEIAGVTERSVFALKTRADDSEKLSVQLVPTQVLTRLKDRQRSAQNLDKNVVSSNVRDETSPQKSDMVPSKPLSARGSQIPNGLRITFKPRSLDLTSAANHGMTVGRNGPAAESVSPLNNSRSRSKEKPSHPSRALLTTDKPVYKSCKLSRHVDNLAGPFVKALRPRAVCSDVFRIKSRIAAKFSDLLPRIEHTTTSHCLNTSPVSTQTCGSVLCSKSSGVSQAPLPVLTSSTLSYSALTTNPCPMVSWAPGHATTEAKGPYVNSSPSSLQNAYTANAINSTYNQPQYSKPLHSVTDMPGYESTTRKDITMFDLIVSSPQLCEALCSGSECSSRLHTPEPHIEIDSHTYNTDLPPLNPTVSVLHEHSSLQSSRGSNTLLAQKPITTALIVDIGSLSKPPPWGLSPDSQISNRTALGARTNQPFHNSPYSSVQHVAPELDPTSPPLHTEHYTPARPPFQARQYTKSQPACHEQNTTPPPTFTALCTQTSPLPQTNPCTNSKPTPADENTTPQHAPSASCTHPSSPNSYPSSQLPTPEPHVEYTTLQPAHFPPCTPATQPSRPNSCSSSQLLTPEPHVEYMCQDGDRQVTETKRRRNGTNNKRRRKQKKAAASQKRATERNENQKESQSEKCVGEVDKINMLERGLAALSVDDISTQSLHDSCITCSCAFENQMGIEMKTNVKERSLQSADRVNCKESAFEEKTQSGNVNVNIDDRHTPSPILSFDSTDPIYSLSISHHSDVPLIGDETSDEEGQCESLDPQSPSVSQAYSDHNIKATGLSNGVATVASAAPLTTPLLSDKKGSYLTTGSQHNPESWKSRPRIASNNNRNNTLKSTNCQPLGNDKDYKRKKRTRGGRGKGKSKLHNLKREKCLQTNHHDCIVNNDGLEDDCEKPVCCDCNCGRHGETQSPPVARAAVAQATSEHSVYTTVKEAGICKFAKTAIRTNVFSLKQPCTEIYQCASPHNQPNFVSNHNENNGNAYRPYNNYITKYEDVNALKLMYDIYTALNHLKLYIPPFTTRSIPTDRFYCNPRKRRYCDDGNLFTRVPFSRSDSGLTCRDATVVFGSKGNRRQNVEPRRKRPRHTARKGGVVRRRRVGYHRQCTNESPKLSRAPRAIKAKQPSPAQELEEEAMGGGDKRTTPSTGVATSNVGEGSNTQAAVSAAGSRTSDSSTEADNSQKSCGYPSHSYNNGRAQANKTSTTSAFSSNHSTPGLNTYRTGKPPPPYPQGVPLSGSAGPPNYTSGWRGPGVCGPPPPYNESVASVACGGDTRSPMKLGAGGNQWKPVQNRTPNRRYSGSGNSNIQHAAGPWGNGTSFSPQSNNFNRMYYDYPNCGYDPPEQLSGRGVQFTFPPYDSPGPYQQEFYRNLGTTTPTAGCGNQPTYYQDPAAYFGYSAYSDYDGYNSPLPWRYIPPQQTPFDKFGPHVFRKTPGASRPVSCGSTFITSSHGSSTNQSESSNRIKSPPTTTPPTNQNEPTSSLFPPTPVLSASDLVKEGTTSLVAGGAGSGAGEETGPQELMVSNLDYNISAREWKKILFTEFQQQVQVIGVTIQMQPDNTSLAFVRVPSVDDARYAISQFHRKKIGYKRIHVSLVDSASGTDQAANLKSEVTCLLQEVSCQRLPLFKFIELYEKRYHRTVSVSDLYRLRGVLEIHPIPSEVTCLLQEVSGQRLPLFKFIELYEKRYHRTVSVSDLYRLRGVLEIREMDGAGRTVTLVASPRSASPGSPVSESSDQGSPGECLESPVCRRHCAEGSGPYVEALDSCSLPCVVLGLKSFAPQVHKLLQAHDGAMPLMSFPACYAAEFGELKPSSDGGVPLEHLISSVPGVNVAVSRAGGVKKVLWAENKPCIPIEWGKSCSSPLLSTQLNQLCREVVDLLRHYPGCRMPFSKFIPAYHNHFGRQCRVADYGYTKLKELFEALSHVVQILGSGSQRFTILSHHAQVKRFTSDMRDAILGSCSRRYTTLSHRAQVKRFTSDMLRVLKAQTCKQIALPDFPIMYNKVIGRGFEITDYGVCYLEDLLAELPENTVIVEGAGLDMLLSLPKREQTADEVESTRQFALEAVDLLKNSPHCQMPFNKFIPAYHHHFGRQCRVSDFGFSKLIELFEALPQVVELCEEDGEKLLRLTQPELLKVLEEHVAALLKSCPVHALPVPDLLAAYMRHHGNSLDLRAHQVSNVVELIDKIPTVARIRDCEGSLQIVLVDNSEVEQLARRVLLVLMEKSDGKMAASALQRLYLEKYGEKLDRSHLARLQQHGDYIKIFDSVDKTATSSSVESPCTNGIADLVIFDSPDKTPTSSSVDSPDPVVGLTVLQQFARDTYTLMRAHQGRLALNMFEAAYAQHFGVSLVAASYGYPSVAALLQAIPHMATIRGKGFRRTVLLSTEFQSRVYLSNGAETALNTSGNAGGALGDSGFLSVQPSPYNSPPAPDPALTSRGTASGVCSPDSGLVTDSPHAEEDLLHFNLVHCTGGGVPGPGVAPSPYDVFASAMTASSGPSNTDLGPRTPPASSTAAVYSPVSDPLVSSFQPVVSAAEAQPVFRSGEASVSQMLRLAAQFLPPTDGSQGPPVPHHTSGEGVSIRREGAYASTAFFRNNNMDALLDPESCSQATDLQAEPAVGELDTAPVGFTGFNAAHLLPDLTYFSTGEGDCVGSAGRYYQHLQLEQEMHHMCFTQQLVTSQQQQLMTSSTQQLMTSAGYSVYGRCSPPLMPGAVVRSVLREGMGEGGVEVSPPGGGYGKLPSTPRRASRLAARFDSSVSPSSVQRRE